MPTVTTIASGGLRKLLYVAGVEATREYLKAERYKSIAPRVQLVVTPFIPTGFSFILEAFGEDFGDMITSASFSKGRGQCAGEFSFTLVDRDDVTWKDHIGQPLRGITKKLGFQLMDMFKPGTFCLVYFDNYLVAQGRIRSARRAVRKGEHGWRREICITGSELGSFYEESVLNLVQAGEELFGTAKSSAQTTASEALAGIAKSLKSGGQLYLNAKQVGVPLPIALKNFASAFIASTLLYGPQFGWNMMSDGFPLAMRLNANPAPFGALSYRTLMGNIVCNTGMLTHDGGGGTFWAFLQSLCPSPWVELFCETGGRTIALGPTFIPPQQLSSAAFAASLLQPGAVAGVSGLGQMVTAMLPMMNYMVLRPAPLNNPLHTWWSPVFSTLQLSTMGVFDLVAAGDFVIVTDDDIAEKDLGTDATDQATAFRADISQSSQQSASVTKPSYSRGPTAPIYPGGMKTWGYKEKTIRVSAGGTAWSPGLAQASFALDEFRVATLSHVLNVWYRNESKFIQGTIVTGWKPYARPGMALMYLPSLAGTPIDNPREIAIYYIENVQHTWNYGSAPTTTFTVIRGTPLPLTAGGAAELLLDWELFAPLAAL